MRHLLPEAGDQQAKDSIESSRTASRDVLVRSFAYGGTAGDRNVHQMTGRVT